MRPAIAMLLTVLGCGPGAAPPATPPGPPAREAPDFDDSGLSFHVQTADGRTRFQQGERIVLRLAFASERPETYRLDAAQYDRVGRLHIDQYEVEPAEGTVDPLADYFEAGITGLGGLRTMPVLTAEETVIDRELNEYVRFDRPGHYTVRVKTFRVENDDGVVELTSQPVELEIVPTDATWAARQLAAAREALGGDEEGAATAARTLRFLGTEEAALVMARALPVQPRGNAASELAFGLIGSPHRAAVIREMRRLLVDPATPVTDIFLSTLALLVHKQDMPGNLGPYPQDDEAASARWQARAEELREHRRQAEDRIAGELVGVLASKEPGPRATCLYTLLTQGWSRSPQPQQLARLRAALVSSFGDLSPERQEEILGYRFSHVAGPELVPVLEGIADAEDTAPDLRARALGRLYEIAPDRGRPRLLAEMRRDSLRLGYLGAPTLLMLPRGPLGIDEALMEAMARTDHEADVRAKLLERYGSPALAPRVERLLQRSADRLGPEAKGTLVAFLLRAAPAAGNRQLAAQATGVYAAGVLQAVADLVMTPAVEDAVLRLLDGDDAAQATAAAEILQEHGTARAEAALWRRVTRFHDAWADRAPELQMHVARDNPNEEQVRLEYVLAQALSQAAGWLTDHAELQRLAGLMVNDNNRQQLQSAVAVTESPPSVSLSLSEDGSVFASVWQYHLDSVDALLAKLAQFPAGTRFTLQVWAPGRDPAEADAARQRLTRFLTDHGMTVAPAE